MKGALVVMKKLYLIAIFEGLDIMRALVTEDGLELVKSSGLAFTILKEFNK
jgi:hypothetical protein